MPKVSVITPAYNASGFIGETIESVLKQTFQDWEMIIVDDCSTDDTYEIACKFSKKDGRIKVFKNKNNYGVAATRNHGLDVATGDYIAFVDSDDLWLPEKLEKQLRFMEEGNIALSFSQYQNYIAATNHLGKIIKVPKIMTAKKILGNTAIGCLTVMINRKMVGRFHMPLLKHTEDNCTWHEILCRGYVGYGIQEVLALYRVGNSSMTSDKSKAARQQWETYREYYKFGFLRSSYYFVKYAVNAIVKHFF